MSIKIVIIVTKLIIVFGMSLMEAINETSTRTGLPTGVIKKMIDK